MNDLGFHNYFRIDPVSTMSQTIFLLDNQSNLEIYLLFCDNRLDLKRIDAKKKKKMLWMSVEYTSRWSSKVIFSLDVRFRHQMRHGNTTCSLKNALQRWVGFLRSRPEQSCTSPTWSTVSQTMTSRYFLLAFQFF